MRGKHICHTRAARTCVHRPRSHRHALKHTAHTDTDGVGWHTRQSQPSRRMHWQRLSEHMPSTWCPKDIPYPMACVPGARSRGSRHACLVGSFYTPATGQREGYECSVRVEGAASVVPSKSGGPEGPWPLGTTLPHSGLPTGRERWSRLTSGCESPGMEGSEMGLPVQLGVTPAALGAGVTKRLRW